MKKKNALFLITGFFCVLLLAGCSREKEYPGTKVVLEGEYVLDDMENINFTFSKNSTLRVVQSGVYEFARNSDGKMTLRMCYADASRELPEDYSYSDYVVEQKGKEVYLTFFSASVQEEEHPVILKKIKGTDGLAKGELFSGTYQIGESENSYRYIFFEDGTVEMQINEHYYAEGEKITLSDDFGSTDYKYELSGERLEIKTLTGENVLSLIKK